LPNISMQDSGKICCKWCRNLVFFEDNACNSIVLW
jgi:hypothetical protein